MRKLLPLALLMALPALAAEPGQTECYKTSITEPTPFLGNGGEIIVLADGTIWKEASYQYLYLYEYNPVVVVCPRARTMTLIGSGTQRNFRLTPIK